LKLRKPAIILNLGFIIQIFIILFITISGIVSLKEADKKITSTYLYLSDLQIVAEKAKFDVLTVQNALKDVGEARTSDQLNSSITEVDYYYKQFYQHIIDINIINNTAKYKDLTANITEVYDSWDPVRIQIVNYTLNEQYDKAAQLAQTTGLELANLIQEKIQVVIDQSKSDTNTFYHDAQNKIQKSFHNFRIFSIIAITISMIAYVYVRLKISNYEDKLRKDIEIITKAEEHFRLLFTSMMNGYALHKMIFDKEGNPIDYTFIEVNPAYEKLTGIKAENCIGKTVLELLPNTESYWIEHYGNVVKTGKSERFENYSIELNKFYDVYAFCPFENYFAVIINDITDSKAMEELIYQEKERLQITFNSIGDGVITTDINKKVMMLNVVAEQFTGWNNENAIGQPFNKVFDITSAITGDKAKDPVDEVLQKDKICELENHTILTARDGTNRHIADSAAPIKDKNGKTTGVVMVFRDVTEKKLNMEKITYLSYHDSLTGLYNRAYFEKQLDFLDTTEMLPISIIIGDVNGLKLLNDVYGHKSGDELLASMARILKENCNKDDVIARWGGDEFAIILPKTSNDEVNNILSKIKISCEKEHYEPILLSISLGASTKTNVDMDLNIVLKDAEDRMYTHKLVEGKSARSTIISSLQKTLYERSCETEEHANRMSQLSYKIGIEINLTQYEMDEMKLLMLLHDVGKIGIPDSILNKPEKLSIEEWYEMKKHPEIGYRIAQSTSELSHIAELILTHHERWDGTGYPLKLVGEQIPKLSRILAIIDTYDVMTHSRPYRKAVSQEEAIQEIIQWSGTQFDPTYVTAFLNIIR